MCTYYLGIVNEKFISDKNSQIDTTISVCLLDEDKTTSEENYHINHEADDSVPINQDFSFFNSSLKINFPEYTNNRNEEDVFLYLFSRPPPFLAFSRNV